VHNSTQSDNTVRREHLLNKTQQTLNEMLHFNEPPGEVSVDCGLWIVDTDVEMTN